MLKKRKRRLLKVDNRVMLPLSEDFVAACQLSSDTILEVDEVLLAQAIKTLTQEDILNEVLQKVMGDLPEGENNEN